MEPHSDQANAQKENFVDKPLVAREYKSEFAEKTLDDVEKLTVKTNRPLIKMRISKRRVEFEGEYNFNDKEGGEGLLDLKPQRDPNYLLKRKVLEIGLQAGSPLIVGIVM